MDFGGYVSYTVGGYKCHPFGTLEIADSISAAASELDLPQSISLRPHRNGFRRTLIKSATGRAVIVYTAFAGLSEPNANRVGSFLAIGVATYHELDCVTNNVGNVLHELLVKLIMRVSDNGRFISGLNVEVFNAFLRDNSPILGNLHSRFVFSGRALNFGVKKNQGIVFLSEERDVLYTTFNRVCQYLPGNTNFYLFDSNAKGELQSVYHDFRVAVWPIKKTQADSRSVSETFPNQPLRHLHSEPGAESGATSRVMEQSKIKDLEEQFRNNKNKVKEKFEQIELALDFWKYVVGALIVVFFVLIVVAIYLGGEQKSEMESMKQQLTVIQECAKQGKLVNENKGCKAIVFLPPAAGHGETWVVRIDQVMKIEAIRKKYCATDIKEKDFEDIFKTMNKDVIDEKESSVKARREITLPVACKNK